MTALARVVPPGSFSTLAMHSSLAVPALASPESTGTTGIKFVGVLVGVALIVAAIRAMFGKKR
jgi:hypothetical protein